MRLRKWHFITLILFYFLVALINLNKVPIAWLDEVMLIDPAHHFLQTGNFASKIWPHEGTENVFLAYLPLSSYVQTINLFLFPDIIFFTRLSSWIALIVCSFFLFKTIKERYQLNNIVIYILLAFFLFDEGISNSMRSGRVEILELALLAASFYFFTIRKYPLVEVICLSLLLIAHPSVYFIVIILFAELMMRKQPLMHKLGYVLILLIPVGSYLYLADFNIHHIYEQLIMHGSEHDETAVDGNMFYLHFVRRFLPVYIPQPYILVLNVLVHALCIYNILTKRSFQRCLIEVCFLVTSIFWFFKLAPFWRYTSVLVLMMFILLPELYKRSLSLVGYIRLTIPKFNLFQTALLWLFLAYAALPFLLRNYTAIIQRPERNEFAVYEWLDRSVPTNRRTLIVDEAIGFYYSMNRAQTDFSLVYSVKKFRFEDYDRVYLLSYKEMPVEYILLSEYRPESEQLGINRHIPQKNILTYNGLKLYEVKSASDLQFLQQ